MSDLTPVVDHVVINVSDKLDDASSLYRRLGFQLTTRGHHSLGSSNHLAVFGENYLELLGYEPGAADLRKAIWTSPPGLNGLVWKTPDADQAWQHLRQQGLAGEPPESFYRPVELPDGSEQQARFRTVRLREGTVPNGRSFFCQHLTPEAVWQPEWQRHRNGVVDITDFVIAASDPQQAAEIYSQLFPAASLRSDSQQSLSLQAGKTTVSFLTPDSAIAQYGSLPADFDGSPRMAALGLRTTSLDAARQSLLGGDIHFTGRDNALLVGAGDACNLALRFWQ